MAEPIDEFLTKWHRIVAEQDLVELEAILAEDVSLGAPPYWPRLEGRALVCHLLGLIVNTIEDFTYQREWRDGGEFALEFSGHVGDLEIQAIDLISLNAAGLVQKLDVLMRPEQAISTLREIIAPQMATYLAAKADAAP